MPKLTSELAALETALAQATNPWNGLVNVSFRYEEAQDASCGPGNTNVFFNVRGVSPEHPPVIAGPARRPG